MIFEKRYLQFNNLVFDGYDMISGYDADVSFKNNTQEYSYGHGSYIAFKNRYLYAKENSVNMTITLKLKKIPCEYRAFYVRFAEEELSRAGKLWAIKNNEILWANAFVANMSQIISHRHDEVIYDVEFVIPSGVWNKADKQRTFLLPYDSCVFMECKGYKEVNPCGLSGDCCKDCEDRLMQIENEDCFCCCVDEVTEDMMLCYHIRELQAFYSCETPYQLVYDCTHGEKFKKDRFLGQKICADVCENVISGRFYSETDIPTDEYTIIIDGIMSDPWVTINGNTNIIKGEYEGTLIIKSSGDIYYRTDCCEELLSPNMWVIPKGNDYGWTINPRGNSIVVNLNNCCVLDRLNCVYVQHTAITL